MIETSDAILLYGKKNSNNKIKALPKIYAEEKQFRSMERGCMSVHDMNNLHVCYGANNDERVDTF